MRGASVAHPAARERANRSKRDRLAATRQAVVTSITANACGHVTRLDVGRATPTAVHARRRWRRPSHTELAVFAAVVALHYGRTWPAALGVADRIRFAPAAIVT